MSFLRALLTTGPMAPPGYQAEARLRPGPSRGHRGEGRRKIARQGLRPWELEVCAETPRQLRCDHTGWPQRSVNWFGPLLARRVRHTSMLRQNPASHAGAAMATTSPCPKNHAETTPQDTARSGPRCHSAHANACSPTGSAMPREPWRPRAGERCCKKQLLHSLSLSLSLSLTLSLGRGS